MATVNKALRDHFEEKKRNLLQPAIRPATKQQACRSHFEEACEEKREELYLSDLERVLEKIGAMHCIGFGKRDAQDERINRLLLSLVTNERVVSPRFRAELMEVVNRRSARTGTRLRDGKAFGCRAELHELRPLGEEHEHHRLKRAHHAMPPWPGPKLQLNAFQ